MEDREKVANYPPRKTFIDGTWDNFGDTINLQTWLWHRGYYNRYRDGDWGYWTTYALQSYLRTQYMGGYPRRRIYAGRVDGVFGNMTKDSMATAGCNFMGGRYMQYSCGGWGSTLRWPNRNVVKSWQYFLQSQVL